MLQVIILQSCIRERRVIFATPSLGLEEQEVVGRIDELRATLRYHVAQTPRRWNGSLRRVMFARAIQGSNTIEGYNATLADAMAVADGEAPLDVAEETAQALAGYRDAMTYVLQLAGAPHFRYSDGLINGLHFMMLKYDITKGPGLFRNGPVFVRHEPTSEIVYEGPPAEFVPSLVSEVIASLEGPAEQTLIRAAMAHLNLVMVHPYRDGNGRIARILQSLVLSRDGILAPEFASIEEYLGRNTQSYYDVLAVVGAGSWQPGRDARPWVRYCLTAHFRQARRVLRRVRQAERLWELLEQHTQSVGVPDRTVVALFDAAQRLRITNRVYQDQADVSEHSGGRDLKRLVDLDLLDPKGEKRGRFYVASPKLLALAEPVWEPDRGAENEDPFQGLQLSLRLPA
jgi:Fic family protein